MSKIRNSAIVLTAFCAFMFGLAAPASAGATVAVHPKGATVARAAAAASVWTPCRAKITFPNAANISTTGSITPVMTKTGATQYYLSSGKINGFPLTGFVVNNTTGFAKHFLYGTGSVSGVTYCWVTRV